MSSTLTIPLTTLPPGQVTVGPSGVADSETKIVLTVDRTVAGGLNSLTSATAVNVDAFQSDDGGATWFLAVGGSMPGGVYLNKGVTVVASKMTVDVYPGTARKLKAVITVSGPSSVAVAGTLVTT